MPFRIKKCVFGLSEDLLLGVVCIPPASSTYSSDEAFEECQTELTVKDAFVCMCGDFNSRTGNVNDRVQGNVFNLFANSITNCENTYLGDKISLWTTNKDKICNKYGCMLLM